MFISDSLARNSAALFFFLASMPPLYAYVQNVCMYQGQSREIKVKSAFTGKGNCVQQSVQSVRRM